jgi:HD-like signal output (HDOD) protein
VSLFASALQRRIEGLRSLAVNPQVALRLVELGGNPDAEIDDYVQLVRLDASLSVRLLALANSTWFSPQHPITTIRRALGMLGINHVQAVAVSHCLSSLFSVLRLDGTAARAYWEASLCKAVAAKWLAQRSPGRRGEEAFAVGLLQDVGVGLLAASDPNEYPNLLNQAAGDIEAQLRIEVERFGMSHAEAGLLIGRKLGLPTHYQNLIAIHHRPPDAGSSTGQAAILQASHVASFLPHDFRTWNRAACNALGAALEQHYPAHWSSPILFLDAIHAEFASLAAMLSHGAWQPSSLQQLLQPPVPQQAAA